MLIRHANDSSFGLNLSIKIGLLLIPQQVLLNLSMKIGLLYPLKPQQVLLNLSMKIGHLLTSELLHHAAPEGRPGGVDREQVHRRVYRSTT